MDSRDFLQASNVQGESLPRPRLLVRCQPEVQLVADLLVLAQGEDIGGGEPATVAAWALLLSLLLLLLSLLLLSLLEVVVVVVVVVLLLSLL